MKLYSVPPQTPLRWADWQQPPPSSPFALTPLTRGESQRKHVWALGTLKAQCVQLSSEVRFLPNQQDSSLP